MKEYNAIIYTGDKATGNGGFCKYRKINNINRFLNFADKKYPAWVFITFYDRKTNEKTLIKKNRVPTVKPEPGSDKLFFPGTKI